MKPDYQHLSHDFLSTLTKMKGKAKDKIISTLRLTHKDFYYLITEDRPIEDFEMLLAFVPMFNIICGGFEVWKPKLEDICAPRGRVDVAELLGLVPSLQSALNACLAGHLSYVKWSISKGVKINFNLGIKAFVIDPPVEKICECVEYVVHSGQYISFKIVDDTYSYTLGRIKKYRIPVDDMEKFERVLESNKDTRKAIPKCV